MSSPDNSGQQSKRRQIGIFEKEQTLFGVYPGIAGYLISDILEVFIGNMIY
jgi:hypothetical protein